MTWRFDCIFPGFFDTIQEINKRTYTILVDNDSTTNGPNTNTLTLVLESTKEVWELSTLKHALDKITQIH